MTSRQKYIISILIIISGLFLLINKLTIQKPQAPAIGDPLELIIVKNTQEFSPSFFKTLKEFLTVSIGPSPQPESKLKLVELEKTKFKGILKRHQNLLIISKSSNFDIKIKRNVFAENQIAILIECPSYKELKKNKEKIIALTSKIEAIEIARLSQKVIRHNNNRIEDIIDDTHKISLTIPKDFFLAHRDSNITWLRRETKKISQGVFIVNLNTFFSPKNKIKKIKTTLDSVLKKHVSGPAENSYMTLEHDAPIAVDSTISINFSGLKIQSLWKMENDFMGGIFNAYYFDSEELKVPIIIYTYVYAPGENKRLFLLQLEAIISTLKKST